MRGSSWPRRGPLVVALAGAQSLAEILHACLPEHRRRRGHCRRRWPVRTCRGRFPAVPNRFTAPRSAPHPPGTGRPAAAPPGAVAGAAPADQRLPGPAAWPMRMPSSCSPRPTMPPASRRSKRGSSDCWPKHAAGQHARGRGRPAPGRLSAGRSADDPLAGRPGRPPAAGRGRPRCSAALRRCWRRSTSELTAAADKAAEELEGCKRSKPRRQPPSSRSPACRPIASRAGYFAGWSNYYLGVARQNAAAAQPSSPPPRSSSCACST